MTEREQTKREIDHTERVRYLIAMAVALGVNKKSASKIAETFLRRVKQYQDLDYKKKREELDPIELAEIESIGRTCLAGTGSLQQDRLAFTIGSRVLSLLNEDPKSGYFQYLDGYIDYWTDGVGGDKFRQLIGK